MLPPILIIAKLIAGIPARRGSLYENEFQDYLRTVENFPLQQLVDSTSGLLTAFHTVLVLLQASTSNFDKTDPNNRKFMEVASFPPNFVEKDPQGNIIGGKLKKSQTIIEDLSSNAPYEDLADSFDKHYPINLVQCFEQLSTLPNGFQIEVSLSECLKSVNVLRPECIKSALRLCHSILLSSNLEEARGWLNNAQPDPITQTAQWLKNHLGIDNNMADQLSAVTDVEVKISLGKIRAMLFESNQFHKEIIDRLDFVEFDNEGNKIEKGNDIKEAIDKIAANLSPNSKTHWTNLQSALFGAVSWHIVNQARYAAGQTSYLFRVSGN